MQLRQVVIYGVKTIGLTVEDVLDLQESSSEVTPFTIHEDEIKVDGITLRQFSSRYDQSLWDAAFIPLFYQETPQDVDLMSRTVNVQNCLPSPELVERATQLQALVSHYMEAEIGLFVFAYLAETDLKTEPPAQA